MKCKFEDPCGRYKTTPDRPSAGWLSGHMSKNEFIAIAILSVVGAIVLAVVFAGTSSEPRATSIPQVNDAYQLVRDSHRAYCWEDSRDCFVCNDAYDRCFYIIPVEVPRELGNPQKP